MEDEGNFTSIEYVKNSCEDHFFKKCMHWKGVIFDRWKASNIVISIEYEACKANDVN